MGLILRISSGGIVYYVLTAGMRPTILSHTCQVGGLGYVSL